ncbi:hypothetical protein Glove_519g23 [Diversispora epigaea]|uniref:SAM domain-containing protein n=1 Tax=Diversispora epigaea TaxID=1348612 RepID=A0A397GGN0_9GLOM|nr:hypothetical protein Glove_519g23 [Diversispora epigaea]
MIITDVIKDCNTDELIKYLLRKDLKLIEADFEIFRKERITDFDFLELTEEKFRSISFVFGPATRLIKFVEHLKAIFFVLQNVRRAEEFFEEIDDDDKALEQCMNEITLRFRIWKPCKLMPTKLLVVRFCVDYAIKRNEDLMRIAESKLFNLKVHIIQIKKKPKSHREKCLSKEYINNETPMLWECNKKHQWTTSF